MYSTHRSRYLLSLTTLFVVIAIFNAPAEVKLPAVFTSNMVLQQGMTVPVWGWADDGEVVTVEFSGQKISATTAQGKWSLKLSPLAMNRTPQTLRVSTPTQTLELTNVLVGEVWLCGGQSNMEWPLRAAFEPAADIAAATNRFIRLLHVPKQRSDTPQTDVNARWTVCTPTNASGFSAIGYYFGRDLQAARNVPVGLIESDWGGTPAESWMRYDVLAGNPRYEKEIVRPLAKVGENYPHALANYQKAKAEAEKSGVTFSQPAPRQPWEPAELYNGMIAPLLPFAIKGVIWYQGEANAGGRAEQYRDLFPDLIRNWREDWGQGDFPFLCVQLTGWNHMREQSLSELTNNPVEGSWPFVREAQLLATRRLPKVGMAVIIDLGEQVSIHPKHKAPVGARLALAARAIAYGEKLEYSGPIYRQSEIHGEQVILHFDHVGQGLEARGGDLRGFAICGPDHQFVWGRAEIVGDTVVVSSPAVPHPVAVRYGWTDFPLVNLWNKDGLPASPFRTDGPEETAR
ncbi:MAG: sialate O-acetylesterase [Verrucomicrobiota bacterium]